MRWVKIGPVIFKAKQLSLRFLSGNLRKMLPVSLFVSGVVKAIALDSAARSVLQIGSDLLHLSCLAETVEFNGRGLLALTNILLRVFK